MQSLTVEELRQCCPQAADDIVAAIVANQATLERAQINTPLRLSHFLAQCAHETGGLTIIREDTSWTPRQMCALWPGRFKTALDPRILACRGDPQRLAELAYGGRQDLGNVAEGDGWEYRGGGLLQITGRAAYHAAGLGIGIDLEGMPEMIEDPVISLNAAVWYWNKHQCNRFADRNYGRAVGNAINRGNPYSRHEPIGYAGRQQWFERIWSVIGEGKPPVSDELALGAYGQKVAHLQSSLRNLGYQVGAEDKVYGPVLARAVAAFKADFKRAHGDALEPDDRIGPATWAAIEIARPATVSPERANATAAELAAAGSTEVKAGQAGKAIGQLTLYGGLFGAASETGALQMANDMLVQIGMLKATAVPALEALQWAVRHGWWLILVLAGIWYWTKGRQVIAARLKAHQLGFNLFR